MEKIFKNVTNVFFIKVTLVQSSMQFFPSPLFTNDRVLRSDCPFSSLNNFKRLNRIRFLN